MTKNLNSQTAKRPPFAGSTVRHDLRTRTGRRAEILAQIAIHNGFSIFWITENPVRASVGQEMQDSGEIITDNSCGYPWFKVYLSNTKMSGHQPPTK